MSSPTGSEPAVSLTRIGTPSPRSVRLFVPRMSQFFHHPCGSRESFLLPWMFGPDGMKYVLAFKGVQGSFEVPPVRTSKSFRSGRLSCPPRKVGAFLPSRKGGALADGWAGPLATVEQFVLCAQRRLLNPTFSPLVSWLPNSVASTSLTI